MRSMAYPLRIPERIMNLAQMRAKEEYVISLIESGRITIGKKTLFLKKSQFFTLFYQFLKNLQTIY